MPLIIAAIILSLLIIGVYFVYRKVDDIEHQPTEEEEIHVLSKLEAKQQELKNLGEAEEVAKLETLIIAKKKQIQEIQHNNKRKEEKLQNDK